MIYQTPTLDRATRARLDELDELRAQLGHETANPSPWLGTLRRQVKAVSVESSVSIEGYAVPAQAARAIVESAGGRDEQDENRLAVACYARAMDHVGVMALDPVFAWSDRVILDLHFDACYFQRDKSPGHWRTGPIGVTAPDGSLFYEAPADTQVIPLMKEVVKWLRAGDSGEHVVIRGAMAHLQVVSVHPFRDGNGRVARIVQSLALAREGILSPEFGSIEEYLGANTPGYYAVLQQVQGGRYQPDRDASEWVRFCIEAHLAQARSRLDQISTAAARWGCLERVAAELGWPDRLVIAMEQSLFGATDRRTYEAEADVSPATASNDFRRLLDAGLVVQTGKGPSVRYEASDVLKKQVAEAVQARRSGADPPPA